MRADKPLLIYVTSDDPTDSLTRKIESVVLASETVAVGTKFFDCIKVSAGSALQDRLLKDAGKTAPRFVLMSRDYKVAKVLQRKGISSGKLIKAMKLAARRAYKTNFDRMVRDYIKLLNGLDRLEGRKAKIADDRARVAAKPSRSKTKKIDRDEKAYEADLEEWKTKEAKLLELRKKGEKPTQA